MDFYYMNGSGPCRSVQMVADVLDLELNLKHLNLSDKEHLTPEYLKINPQHTIPTLVDNGFALWESRAILCYLVDKYGKDDSLYPKDPTKRAVVNQRLYFDMGSLYQRSGGYYYPMFVGKEVDPEKLTKLDETIGFLDIFLENSKYVAGDNLTIADYAIVVNISNVELCGYDLKRYTNINKWYELMKKAPGYEINEVGIEAMKVWIEKMSKK